MSDDRLLLCTDLDRTLIPNGPGPESPEAMERFARLAAHEQVTLAYVSGRHRALVEEAIAGFGLPVPDFIIGDVGTTIYRVDGGIWQRDHAWEEEIGRDWGGRGSGELALLLSGIAGLQLQEESKQNRCKLSYYLPLHEDSEALAGVIAARLKQEGVRARLIWSIDEPAAVGLLDILPGSASKFHAIQALIRHYGFGIGQTVFCGDSGNDIEVLASNIPSVLVANSSDEVRQEALRKAEAGGHEKQLYIARGGFMGMNGNYAAGILEGVAHYHPGAEVWMQDVERVA